MSPVLVDSNVFIDALSTDEAWRPWSVEALAAHSREALLVLNPIIFAEVAMGFDTIEDVEAGLPPELFRREALPWEAAFLAGQAYLAYRKKGGPRRSPLPDFYIGAHAAIRGYRLLTRDPRRYRTYFPSLEVIAPD
jgi:predicted nucleic acid-binding protein